MMMNAAGFTPWPDESAARYRQLGIWGDDSIFEAVARVATDFGPRIALVDHRSRYTYAETLDAAERLASGLYRTGLRPADRIVIQLPNCNEFVITLLACCRLGITPVMALPAHRRHELEYLINFSGARAYAGASTFANFDYQALARELCKRCHNLAFNLFTRAFDVNPAPLAPALLDLDALLQDDTAPGTHSQPAAGQVALYLLSGGTTGLPKLIPRTHADYLYNARRAAELAGLDATTRYLVALPGGHNFPLACPGILGTLLHGGRVIMLGSPRAESAFAAMTEHAVNISAVVPAVALAWIEYALSTGERPTSLDVLQVGGSVFAPEAAGKVAPVLGATLQQAFGMAEGLINLTRLDDPVDAIVATQGRPMSPQDEIRVVDESGLDVAPGERGELYTRGPYTLRGYFNAPEHNARSFTEDGFYRTGDVVRLQHDGNLVVEGRTKDLINRGGEKISAEEIENLCLAHSAVFNAAAVAMPDPGLGERVAIVVTLHRGQTLSLDELIEFLQQRDIAPYKLPEKLLIKDSLPLTNVGKIDKKQLRDELATG